MDQTPDSASPAGRENVIRPQHVGFVIRLVRTPNSRFRSHVKNHIATGTGFADRVGVANVTAHNLHVQPYPIGEIAPSETPYAVTTSNQLLHNHTTQEPTAAGNQRFHGNRSAAHTATFSRTIFELCRESTGNDG